MATDGADVPTWINAITTSLAFLAAAWVVGIELRRDKRAAEDKAKSEQAAYIAAWPEGGAAVLLRNGSTLPIYDVLVIFRHENGKEARAGQEYAVLPPGDHSTRFPGALYETDELGNVTNDQRALWFPALNFRDSAGRRWRRQADGQLVQRHD